MRIQGRRVLLVITGSIAAYKSLDLIRRLRENGAMVRAIVTAAGERFVTPLAVSALTGERVFTDLFSLTDEQEIGHIRLAQDCDLVVVAPASADFMAKMALGLAGDLASTALLATDRPILVAPAMNHRMWAHPATQAHRASLAARGVACVGPGTGPLAEGESGPGRMAEVPEIVEAVMSLLAGGPLRGRRAVVTSGPTFEPIDPVRMIANRSSGRQGHAIAAELARLGAEVTLVSGPVAIADPMGCRVVRVETACQMRDAVLAAGPADIAVCAAAVGDWRPETVSERKMKKVPGVAAPVLTLTQNPDILATLSAAGPERPRLVVGFAAETDHRDDNAAKKRAAKGCDWMLANDAVFGAPTNQVRLITADGAEDWPLLDKTEVARRLAARIAAVFGETP